MSWKIPAEHRASVAGAPAPTIGGLGPRLSAVARAVPKGSAAADIGADHGHLSRGLLASGQASFVYAIDASEPALSGARRALAHDVEARRASVRLGDGFDALTLEDHGGPAIECAVLAGIGSRTALDIVRRGLALGHRPPRIVFQPSAGEHDVRQEMLELGYGIVSEDLVAEGPRLFMVIAFEDGRGITALKDLVDLYVGPFLRDLQSPAMEAWLSVQTDWLAEIIDRTRDEGERGAWQNRLRSIETLGRRRPQTQNSNLSRG